MITYETNAERPDRQLVLVRVTDVDRAKDFYTDKPRFDLDVDVGWTSARPSTSAIVDRRPGPIRNTPTMARSPASATPTATPGSSRRPSEAGREGDPHGGASRRDRRRVAGDERAFAALTER
jgi:catechol 2,3-dioxygenase-like lactoylglutathione lyase family enzyme